MPFTFIQILVDNGFYSNAGGYGIGVYMKFMSIFKEAL